MADNILDSDTYFLNSLFSYKNEFTIHIYTSRDTIHNTYVVNVITIILVVDEIIIVIDSRIKCIEINDLLILFVFNAL